MRKYACRVNSSLATKPADLLRTAAPVQAGHSTSLASDLSELTKARLTVMVLLTTLAGYCLASHGAFDWIKLVHTLLGTALVAICSSILNQALERDTDALMRRTQVRPVRHAPPAVDGNDRRRLRAWGDWVGGTGAGL